MKTYYIFTFGCQANLADSERIARKLEMSGYKKATKPELAKLIVINACSVRQSAIDRVYGKIKNFTKLKIVVAGCVLEADKKKILAKNKNIEFWHPDEYFDLTPIQSNTTIASIPIMTGCNNFCSYCAVPHTRGKERSRPVEDIVKDIEIALNPPAGGGIKEIWLLGQNVNSYRGKTVKTIDFSSLLRIVNSIPGDFWIRFTSPHPKDFSDDLIKTMAECEKFPHYINLPVQAGNNEILKKMNRPYTVDHYKKLIKKIRKAMPDIAISTDVIVGFPGETKKQFQDTVKLMKEVKFDMAFLSEYSTRPGTLAAKKYKDNVPEKEKARRKNVLNEILKKTSLENNKKLIGKTVKVLNNRTEGNKLVKISAVSHRPSANNWTNVKITKATPWHLEGRPVQQSSGRVIVVLGPTASGKSEFAVKLAKKLNGEVISADSRQVYKELNIGSGKITKKEMRGVPHHCLNIVSPKKVFTAVDFKKCAQEAMEDILKRGKTPIICGGTGFYIDVALGKTQISEVAPNWKLRKQLEKKSVEELFKILKKINPERAKNIDAKNPRRLIRAIEINTSAQFKFLAPLPASGLRRRLQIQTAQTKMEPVEFLQIGIKLPEKELEKKIEKRVKKMVSDGLLNEVKKLKKSGLSWKRIYELGFEYKYPAMFLQGKITKDEMLERMIIENRQYAKRQMTWFKRDKKIKWINKTKDRSIFRSVFFV